MNAMPTLPAAESYGSPENPWHRPDGSIVSCTEKLKVLRENMDELRQTALDALEDAVLMGCDEAQVKEAFVSVILSLNSGLQDAKDQGIDVKADPASQSRSLLHALASLPV
ncbi:MAG: hypothetical protein RJA63_3516 [Pseudomonadota bacterium]|jgi:hypothetical protein